MCYNSHGNGYVLFVVHVLRSDKVLINMFLGTDVPSLILDDSEDENASSIFETSCPSGSPKKQSSAAIHKPYLHFTM